MLTNATKVVTCSVLMIPASAGWIEALLLQHRLQQQRDRIADRETNQQQDGHPEREPRQPAAYRLGLRRFRMNRREQVLHADRT